MLDVVIRGDQVVTPWGVGNYDIGIKGEKIVTVQSLGTITGDVGRVIDATGKIVIPGGIEPHAHSRFLHHQHAAGPDVLTQAAIWGGTTTLCDFAYQRAGWKTEGHDKGWVQKEPVQPKDIFQSIEEQKAQYQGEAYSDYIYHCLLMGEPSTDILSQIGEAIKAGFPSFKLFTTNGMPPKVGVQTHYFVNMGHVSAIMEQVAAHGGILMVHGEDEDIVMYNYARLLAENRTEWYNMHLAHSSMSEDVSFQRVIRVAKWTGAAVYFVHVSAKEGVWNIQEARSKGQPIYGETLHNYVTFTVEDYKKPDGMKYQTYPSLKFDEDRKVLWDGLITGSMSCMATDELATTYEVKTRGKTIFDVVGGQMGTETRVGITYTEGVAKRGMSLQRFVDVVSANAAKIMGLYPRKGAIAPGSDADIVFIDPKFRKKLTLDDLHCLDYSIWEGWKVSGWPVFTMLRGKVMVEGGKMVGKKGYGQLIPGRKIDPEIIRRPMC